MIFVEFQTGKEARRSGLALGRFLVAYVIIVGAMMAYAISLF